MWIMKSVAEGDLPAVIDVEIVQEILHRYGALERWSIAADMSESLMAVVPLVLPITVEDMALAVELSKTYGPRGVKARDVIHAAVMQNNGLSAIISADVHFDKFEGLTRIDPQRLFAEQG
jgi:predicted nucleic acid-binding protein